MRVSNLFQNVKKRHVLEVALLYLGIGWGLTEVTDFAIDNYELSRKLLDVTVMLLVLGFPAALVIAWFHGERGEQAVTRPEILILTTLFVMASVGTYQISTAEEPPARASPAAAEGSADLGVGSIAVLPFTNNTGADSLDWLGAGFSDLVTSNLAQLPELNVVSPQRLFDLLRDEGREETERIPEQFAMDVATRSGARLLARGRILVAGDELIVDVQLIQLSDGTVLGAERARGSDVFALADSVAARLSLRLLGSPADRPRPERSPMTLTGNLESYRRFQADVRARWRELDPEDVKTRYRLAALYAMMPGRLEERQRVLDEILAIDPLSGPAYYGLAELAIRRGDEAAVDPLLARYAELEPDAPTMHGLLGQLYERAGRHEEARDHYREIATADPASSLTLIVRTYLREDRTDAALAELEPQLSAPELAVATRARLLLGDVSAWEGRFAEALGEYEAARAMASRAGLDALRSEAAKSGLDLEELLTSERPAVFNRSIWSLLERELGTRALDLVEAAEELHLRDLERHEPAVHNTLLYARGRALELMGYPELALSAYRELIERWGPALAEIPLMRDLELRAAGIES